MSNKATAKRVNLRHGAPNLTATWLSGAKVGAGGTARQRRNPPHRCRSADQYETADNPTGPPDRVLRNHQPTGRDRLAERKRQHGGVVDNAHHQ